MIVLNVVCSVDMRHWPLTDDEMIGAFCCVFRQRIRSRRDSRQFGRFAHHVAEG